MLKREITYEDLNGEKITDVFYFNISKPELIELEVEQKQGFGAWITAIIEAKDHKTLIEQFKRIIFMSYGVRSEDNKRFIKSEELSKGFSQTNAYEVLFVELATDDEAASTFLKGILPKDVVGEVDKALAAVPPTPPTPPATT